MIGDKKVASGNAPSLFKNSIKQNLRIAKDLAGNDKIGNYEEPIPKGPVFALRGEIQNASIELKAPSALVEKVETSNSGTVLKPIQITL